MAFLFWVVIIGIGVSLWFSRATEGFGDWLLKFVFLASLSVGPYVFWDDLAAYWRSSGDGPVNIETGWW